MCTITNSSEQHKRAITGTVPKFVDREARRMELAEAVWRVIDHAGMNGATVRAVAAEAQISPGALRHYFSDQAGLLRFAAETMTHRVTLRLQRHLTDVRGGIEWSRRVLEEVLPLDANRRVEVAVWLEGITQARYDSALAELKAAGWLGEQLVCRTAWANARGLPLPRQRDERLEAHDEAMVAQLHTFMDGLTLHAIAYPEQVNATQASQQVRDVLAMLLREADAHASAPPEP